MLRYYIVREPSKYIILSEYAVLTTCLSMIAKTIVIVLETCRGLTYLNGTSSNMTIVRESSCERRAVIECVKGFALCQLKLLLESVNLLPILKYLLFLFREVRSLGNYNINNVRCFPSRQILRELTFSEFGMHVKF